MVCQGSALYTAICCITLCLNGVLCGQSLYFVLVFNFTNMYAMSYWSDDFSCSCRVNICEPAVCYTASLFSAVFWVILPSFLITTAISDTTSFDSSLLEVMIWSKSQRVFTGDLSDLTLRIIFDAWWASMNVGSKRPIAWNASRHAPLWQFYFHFGIEESGSPGIICIIWH